MEDKELLINLMYGGLISVIAIKLVWKVSWQFFLAAMGFLSIMFLISYLIWRFYKTITGVITEANRTEEERNRIWKEKWKKS